jgi:hypothetical protein
MSTKPTFGKKACFLTFIDVKSNQNIINKGMIILQSAILV